MLKLHRTSPSSRNLLTVVKMTLDTKQNPSEPEEVETVMVGLAANRNAVNWTAVVAAIAANAANAVVKMAALSCELLLHMLL